MILSIHVYVISRRDSFFEWHYTLVVNKETPHINRFEENETEQPGIRPSLSVAGDDGESGFQILARLIAKSYLRNQRQNPHGHPVPGQTDIPPESTS